MKNAFLISVLIAIPFFLTAQSVGISANGALPNSTAMLDVSSNNKGMLVPRMRTIDRLGIQTPAVGLLVYDINTSSFWVYNGAAAGGWAELVHSDNQLWKANGSDIYNTNIGRIGIGTKNPGENLHIHDSSSIFSGMQFTSQATGQSANDGMVVGIQFHGDAQGNRYGMISVAENIPLLLKTSNNIRLRISSGGNVGIGGSILPTELLTLDTINPVLQFKNAGVDKGFVQIVGDDMKIGTNLANESGKFIVRTKGKDRLFVSEVGNVGIGFDPGVQYSLRISNSFEPILPPSIEFVHYINSNSIETTGSISASKNNFAFWAANNARMEFLTNGNSRMTISSNGNVGIGTYTPASILTINAASPVLQLQNNEIDKGFIQIVNDDIKIGTNLSNANGSFIVRTNGVDRLKVDNAGNVGVGTTSPGVKFQVGANGDGSLARANAWQTFSDERYKADIVPIDHALDKLGQVNGYYYNWKSAKDKTRQAGLLAQEVEEVLPEIVSTDADGYKSVDYGKMNALLLQAIKEQQHLINELFRRLEKLDK